MAKLLSKVFHVSKKKVPLSKSIIGANMESSGAGDIMLTRRRCEKS